MAERIGAIMEFTDCGLDYDRDLLRSPTHSTEFPLDTFLRKWHQHVKDKMMIIVPDVVLSDQYSACGTVCANQLNIPLVVNVPQNLAQLELDNYDVVNMRKATSCCGMICIKRSFDQSMQTLFERYAQYYNHITRYQHTNVWLINSFWGIDKPTALPPNIILTGCLAKFDAPYMQ